jgi:hypothetical protein
VIAIASLRRGVDGAKGSPVALGGRTPSSITANLARTAVEKPTSGFTKPTQGKGVPDRGPVA